MTVRILTTDTDTPKRPGVLEMLTQSSLGRCYLFTGLGAQCILAVALAQAGGLPALAPIVIGCLGLLMRWTATPILFLMLFVFFLAFPEGLPVWNVRSDIPRSFCRVSDLILVFVTVAYLVCYYRMLGLLHDAMPSSRTSRGSSQDLSPVLRRENHSFESEYIPIAAVLFIVLILVQIAYLMMNHLLIDMRAFPPVHWVDEFATRHRMSWTPEFPVALHRLLVFILGTTIIVSIVGFSLWYWGLNRLQPQEARMMIRDVSWRESRRELNRQAKWRAWVQRRMPRPSFLVEMRQYLQWILWVVLVVLILILVIGGISYIRFIME
ncbi:MAG: hypothetical protein LC104_05570 [Bacteroidales bacterium]|nr:hypothetical protein [Bacteroidales bacterium]